MANSYNSYVNGYNGYVKWPMVKMLCLIVKSLVILVMLMVIKVMWMVMSNDQWWYHDIYGYGNWKWPMIMSYVRWSMVYDEWVVNLVAMAIHSKDR